MPPAPNKSRPAGARAHAVIADKGYDADPVVKTIEDSATQAVIPPRSNRLVKKDLDRHLH